MLLRREWRDALKSGPLALLLPVLAVAAGWLLPPATHLPMLAILAGTLGLTGTARRLWRERRTGCLHRLALSPLPAAVVLGARLLARATVVAAQVAPALAVAAWRQQLLPVPGAPGGWWSLPLAALGATVAGVSAGAIVGLRAERWARVHVSAALLLVGALLLLMPVPPAMHWPAPRATQPGLVQATTLLPTAARLPPVQVVAAALGTGGASLLLALGLADRLLRE